MHEKNPPSVRVLSIELATAEQLAKCSISNPQTLEPLHQIIFVNLRSVTKRAFFLEWAGENKIPQGAQIQGKEIFWTQNGRAIDSQGNILGVYERLLKFGGTNKLQHQMLVFAL